MGEAALSSGVPGKETMLLTVYLVAAESSVRELGNTPSISEDLSLIFALSVTKVCVLRGSVQQWGRSESLAGLRLPRTVRVNYITLVCLSTENQEE